MFFETNSPPSSKATQVAKPVTATESLGTQGDFWRLFIADAGSPYDVIEKEHLLAGEATSLQQAPNTVRLHGAGGVIESGHVAKANLKGLSERIHPCVLDECPGLLSVGFRCRRAG